MLKVGIVGFGFMGRTHYRCWQGNGQVVAICDKKADLVSDSSESKGNIDSTADEIDFDSLKLYTDLDEMLACEDLDAISLAVPTWLHVESCVKALAAGVNVLCEKPMALNVADCQTMMAAAADSGKILQIGHCVRFWPEYAATKKMIASGKYGKVLAGSFRRLCTKPNWGAEDWFLDEKRSGGMVLDLHIHDTDYVQYLFGMPEEVYSCGVEGEAGITGHIITHYDYGDNKVIVAEGGWLMAESFGFEMSFNIVLEKATITYDCNRSPAFKVCFVEGQSFVPAVAEGDGYALEVAHFAKAVSGAEVEDVISLEQSCNSVRIIEAEKKVSVEWAEGVCMIKSKCGDWPIGVCSWSLKKDISQWGELFDKWGIGHVNLGVGPVLQADSPEYLETVAQNGWVVSSTMIGFEHEDYSTLDTIKATGGIGPEEYWADDKATVLKAMDVTAELGVKYLAMHAGFIDYTRPDYSKSFHDRFKELVKAAEDKGVVLLMETGQESATELRCFLEEMDSEAVGVNFDPANMILYNKGNPIEAVSLLGPWIKHVHVKDAVYTTEPGTWGQEVPWGGGQVGTDLFLQALKEVNYNGVLSIEREQGDDPLGDISKAVSG